MSSWIPTIPPPSFGWFSSSKKLGPLPEFKATVTPKIVWQVAVGKAAPGLEPGDRPRRDLRRRRRTARSCASIPRPARPPGASRRPSAFRRPPARMRRSSPSARTRATCSPSPPDGKPLWQAKVTSEVVSPPKVAEGIVVVWSGDGRVFGVSAADGKTKWVYQRNNPPLTVRNFSGGVITRGGLFVGTAGGKLLALDLATGNMGWEAQRRDAQGRDRARADRRHHVAAARRRPARRAPSPIRDASRASTSFAARSTGRATCRASKASSPIPATSTSPTTRARSMPSTRPPAPRRGSRTSSRSGARAVRRSIGDYVAVVDGEGYVHLLDTNDGSLVGPRRDRRHGGHRPAGEVRATPRSGKAPAGRCSRSASANVGRRRQALPRALTRPASVLDRPRAFRRLRTPTSPCCPLSSSSGARTSANRRCSIG